MTEDPFLIALHDVYLQTLDRLRRSFVGPDPIRPPQPVSCERFTADGGDPAVESFRDLERRGREAAGTSEATDVETAYARYEQWLPFARRQRVVLDRVADRLGYERPQPSAAA